MVKNIDEFNVMWINEKSPIGYFLEVDLEYFDKLHELHNDYPLAPKKHAVSRDMLSKYCKKIAVCNKSWWCKKINSKFMYQN